MSGVGIEPFVVCPSGHWGRDLRNAQPVKRLTASLRTECTRRTRNPMNGYEDKHPVVQFHGHVDPAAAGGVFRGHVQSQGHKTAIENRGIIAFVVGQAISAIPQSWGMAGKRA